MNKKNLLIVLAFIAVAALGISVTSCVAQRTLSVSQDTVSCRDGVADTVRVNFKMQEQYRSTKKTAR